MLILDTNVISECMRAAPDPLVVEWLTDQPSSSVFLTSVTTAELRYGVAILPDGRRKAQIEQAIQAMFEEDFAGRILPFDEQASCAYAQIAAGRRDLGRPISQFDCQIAAIAAVRGAAVATRNTNDFADCGIEVLDPWQQ